MLNLFWIIIATIIVSIPFALLMVLFAKINLKYGNKNSHSVFDYNKSKYLRSIHHDVTSDPSYFYNMFK